MRYASLIIAIAVAMIATSSLRTAKAQDDTPLITECREKIEKQAAKIRVQKMKKKMKSNKYRQATWAEEILTEARTALAAGDGMTCKAAVKRAKACRKNGECS